jgi:hypothetical protein
MNIFCKNKHSAKSPFLAPEQQCFEYGFGSALIWLSWIRIRNRTGNTVLDATQVDMQLAKKNTF